MNMIQKGVVLLGVAVVLPFVAGAAMVRGGEEYFLRQGEVISDDLYAAGGNINLSGSVTGDAMIAGGNLSTFGKVGQDLLMGGGQINISGEVGGDVRAAGGNLTIGANIGEDLVVAGGNVLVDSRTTIGRSAILAGGRVVLDGSIGENARIAGGEVVVNGTVNGNLEVRADKVTIGNSAVVRGNFTYTAREMATVSEKAQILGETVYYERQAPIPAKDLKGFFAGLFAAWVVMKIVLLIVAAVALTLLFPKASRALIHRGMQNIGGELLRGFVVVVIVPVAAILLCVTVIGIPLGILALLIYILTVFLASIYAGPLFGTWLMKSVFKKAEHDPNWQTAVLGVLALALVGFVPFIGWIVCTVVFFVSVGSIVKGWYQMFWAER